MSNPTGSVLRILMLSWNADPDVAEYPETGKIGIITDGETWEFLSYRPSANDWSLLESRLLASPGASYANA